VGKSLLISFITGKSVMKMLGIQGLFISSFGAIVLEKEIGCNL
jgi:hypothetical protein